MPLEEFIMLETLPLLLNKYLESEKLTFLSLKPISLSLKPILEYLPHKAWMRHWLSSHYTVTHVRNKNSNIQGRSLNVVKVIFNAIRNCS